MDAFLIKGQFYNSHQAFKNSNVRTLSPQGVPQGIRAYKDAASWSPDGSRIAVSRSRQLISYNPKSRGDNVEGAVVLFTMGPEGEDVQVLVRVGTQDLVTEAERVAGIPDCSSDRVVPNPEFNPKLVRDCEILISLEGGFSKFKLDHWRPDKPMKKWKGIRIGGQPGGPLRVTEILIPGQQLNGKIPGGISELTGLELISLGNNRLGGGMPRFQRLERLRELYLSGNRLTGEIPEEFGALGHLEYLDLTDNQLTGCIPTKLPNKEGLVILSDGLQPC